MESKYDLFKIKCYTSSTIKINYYKAEKDGSTIKLYRGESTNFFI
jgi:hypothetical protein